MLKAEAPLWGMTIAKFRSAVAVPKTRAFGRPVKTEKKARCSNWALALVEVTFTNEIGHRYIDVVGGREHAADETDDPGCRPCRNGCIAVYRNFKCGIDGAVGEGAAPAKIRRGLGFVNGRI
jgi:hypothetical protein